MKINNFWPKLQTVLMVVSIVVAGMTWYFHREKSTSLDIEQVTATLLTQDFAIEGLTVKYQYHDSIEVKKLWKTVFVIKNVGDETLYGKGFSEINLRNGVIPLSVSNCDNMLSMSVADNLIAFQNENQELVVTQWKPNEYVEVEVLTEGDSVPRLIIDERGIKNAKISYSQYSPSDKAYTRLIDYFPNMLREILKSVSMFVIMCNVGAIIGYIFAQAKGKSKSDKFAIVVVLIVVVFFLLFPLLWMF
ncbi:MAG: hypothetical protein K2L03_07470 [Bacteroidales bacterium]|nr:hypothetical protein [Bacteroidales bacterium]